MPKVEKRLSVAYTPFGPVYTELGYRAADVIRKSGRIQPTGGSGDYHARWDLKLLRAESQRFDRDNGIYTGTVNRLLDNILGDGFRFQARTDNQRLNRQLEALWADWCKTPEVRGLDDWAALERLACRHVIVDGDVAAIKLDTGQVQLIEAERIDYPATARNRQRVENGVEVDAVGRPVTFYIGDYDGSGQVQRRPKPYNASDVVYMAHRQRISQTRGVPLMVPSFPMFHRINDVCDSEAVAWQLLSRIAVGIYRKDAAAIADLTASTDDSKESPPDVATRYHDIGDAIIFHGEPGEEIKGIERTLPGADFPESIKAFMRLLGLPIGFPLELMMLDWSNTNYSSARAALLQAYRMLKRWQRMLIRSWHGPIYRWRVRSWIQQGLLSGIDWVPGKDETDPGRPSRMDVMRHEWFPPPFPWVDPKSEADAAAVQIDRGFTTHGEALKEQNRDREESNETRAREIREAIAIAKSIEAETGERVPWQLFAGLDPAKAPAAPTGESGEPTADEKTVDFQRDVVKAFIADGTVADVIANGTDIMALVKSSGLPHNPKYVEPWLPVQDAAGNPVSGDVVKDPEGDVVGGAVEEVRSEQEEVRSPESVPPMADEPADEPGVGSKDQ